MQEECLTEELPPLPEEAGKPEAEQLLRRLRKLRWRMAENETVVLDAQDWLERENKPLLDEVARIEGLLASWLAARIARDPKAPKSERLPSGEVSSRAGGLRVEIDDHEAFSSWAITNRPGLLRVPPAPPAAADRAAIKAALLPDCGLNAAPGMYGAVAEGGEVVPGITFVREERQFVVKTS